MLTEKDYCNYETCVALKELRFNILVDWYFNEDKIIVSPLARCRSTSIPRISLYEAQKWLREVKKVIIVIVPYTYNIITETSTWTYEIWLEDNLEREVHDFKTYEEALSEGVRASIKMLKEK